MFERVISTTHLALKILNLPGGIIGGIWLLSIGQWKVVIGSLIANILFFILHDPVYRALYFLASLAIPSSARGQRRLEIPKEIRTVVIAVLTLAWTVFVVSAIFHFEESIPLLPFLLIGYSVVTGCFAVLSLRQGEYKAPAYAAVYLSQICFIALSTFAFLGLRGSIAPVIGILFIFFIIHAARIGPLVSGNVKRRSL